MSILAFDGIRKGCKKKIRDLNEQCYIPKY